MRKPALHLRRALPVIAAMLALALSACGTGQELPATPTMNVTAIYTQAFQTLTSMQATQAALTPPSPAPTQTAAATAALPATGATSVVPNTGGATATAGGTASTAATCDNAVYVSDVTIPDGTSMIPGQNFVKTWAVKNAGTCPWTTDYKLVFLNGEAMGGASVPLTAAVAPGTTANLSVALVAPTLGGAYTGSWRLQNAGGAYFGDVITVVINVSGTGGAPAATSTP